MVQRADKQATLKALLQKAGSREKLKLVKVEEGKYSKTKPFLNRQINFSDICKRSVFLQTRYATYAKKLDDGYVRKLSCMFGLKSDRYPDRITGTILLPMVDCYFEVKEIKHVI